MPDQTTAPTEQADLAALVAAFGERLHGGHHFGHARLLGFELGAGVGQFGLRVGGGAHFLRRAVGAEFLLAGGARRVGDGLAEGQVGDVVEVQTEMQSFPIFRHNGRAAEMVTAELAGDFEAPLYGIIVRDALFIVLLAVLFVAVLVLGYRLWKMRQGGTAAILRDEIRTLEARLGKHTS